jgi:hypothetical protein
LKSSDRRRGWKQIELRRKHEEVIHTMGDQPTTMCMSESIDGEVQLGEIMFCDLHEDEVRMALIQRGFSQDLELTLDEREAKMLSGEMDAFVSVKNRLIMNALGIFGPQRVMSYDGCPVCVFHAVIEQAADDIASERVRKN